MANCKCRHNKRGSSAANVRSYSVGTGNEDGDDRYNLITTDENEHHVTRYHEDDDNYEQHLPNNNNVYEEEDGNDDNFSTQDDYNIKTNEIKRSNSRVKLQSKKSISATEKSPSDDNLDLSVEKI